MHAAWLRPARSTQDTQHTSLQRGGVLTESTKQKGRVGAVGPESAQPPSAVRTLPRVRRAQGKRRLRILSRAPTASVTGFGTTAGCENGPGEPLEAGELCVHLLPSLSHPLSYPFLGRWGGLLSTAAGGQGQEALVSGAWPFLRVLRPEAVLAGPPAGLPSDAVTLFR